jgi:hypothetical protein
MANTLEEGVAPDTTDAVAMPVGLPSWSFLKEQTLPPRGKRLCKGLFVLPATAMPVPRTYMPRVRGPMDIASIRQEASEPHSPSFSIFPARPSSDGSRSSPKDEGSRQLSGFVVNAQRRATRCVDSDGADCRTSTLHRRANRIDP